MTYNDNSQSLVKENETVFSRINSSLKEYNSKQSKFILEIEDKLHLILNKRSPQGEVEHGKENNVQDAYTEIGLSFNTLSNNTNRLVVILDHLKEII